ncbi:DMT family transporter [Candidatus Spongiihabitans sp.]|uniref:DMT family transporter n=1 Tax=Candidatus Spongiihabitans sp. TaxID=3101308 RepID=UPI003C7AD218
MTDRFDGADRPMLGIVLMLVGIAAFSVMDATIKWLTADFPVPQVVALRSWFGLPLLCLLAHFEGGLGALKTSRPLAHIGRYILVLALSFSFFWALSQMKLADVVAITFAAPIFITLLSVPLLKEAVGLRRWAAIGAGFCGVLIMLRPGAGVFQWAALVALGSAAVYALLMITTRALKSTESTVALMLYPQLGMTLTGIIIAPFFWVSPSLGDLGLFALAGLFGSIGVICLTHAFRLAPAAVVSPFEYSALIWATLLGFLLWRELPDTPTMVGVGIVVASGLYIIYRETIKIGRAQPRLPSMSPDDTGQ